MALSTTAVLGSPGKCKLAIRLNYDAQEHDKWDTCFRWLNRKYPTVCEILISNTSRRKLAIRFRLCYLSSWTTVYKSCFNNIPFYKPIFRVTSFQNFLELFLPVTGPVVAQRVGRGIALLLHDHGTRRGWVVSSTPRPYFTPGKDPIPIVQEVGWAPDLVWTGGKSRPTGIRSPDRPSRSQSLYRLSYPAHSPIKDMYQMFPLVVWTSTMFARVSPHHEIWPYHHLLCLMFYYYPQQAACPSMSPCLLLLPLNDTVTSWHETQIRPKCIKEWVAIGIKTLFSSLMCQGI
jgi:hypothetical protein